MSLWRLRLLRRLCLVGPFRALPAKMDCFGHLITECEHVLVSCVRRGSSCHSLAKLHAVGGKFHVIVCAGPGPQSWILVRRTPLLRLSGQVKEIQGVAHRQTIVGPACHGNTNMRQPEQQHPALNDTPETHRDQQTRAVQESAIPTLQRCWKAENETLKTTCGRQCLYHRQRRASKWAAVQIIAPYTPETRFTSFGHRVFFRLTPRR